MEVANEQKRAQKNDQRKDEQGKNITNGGATKRGRGRRLFWKKRGGEFKGESRLAKKGRNKDVGDS